MISIIAYSLLRLIRLTLRFQIINKDNRIKADPPGNGPFALASWHQNTLLATMTHCKDQICVMISSSADGEMIAKVVEWFGMTTCRGSSSVGGQKALAQMIQRAKNGKRVAFTVDGPKGPPRIVKKGIVTLAAQTGIPILPVLPIADRYWEFTQTWDHFRLPQPFAKVSIIYGEPIFVPPNAHPDDYCQRLKECLDRLENHPCITSN